MTTILFILIGYILGSIPFGLVFTRLAGYKDIRKLGSGNIGTTNVIRNTNVFLGALTLICDSGKGALAIFIASMVCNNYDIAVYAGVAAVIGHIFPIWLKFQGGKGVATALAVFLMLNLDLGIIACCTWVVVFAIARIAGMASVVSFAVTSVIACFIIDDIRLLSAVLLISILVIFRHSKNLKEIYRKLRK